MGPPMGWWVLWGPGYPTEDAGVGGLGVLLRGWACCRGALRAVPAGDAGVPAGDAAQDGAQLRCPQA